MIIMIIDYETLEEITGGGGTGGITSIADMNKPAFWEGAEGLIIPDGKYLKQTATKTLFSINNEETNGAFECVANTKLENGLLNTNLLLTLKSGEETQDMYTYDSCVWNENYGLEVFKDSKLLFAPILSIHKKLDTSKDTVMCGVEFETLSEVRTSGFLDKLENFVFDNELSLFTDGFSTRAVEIGTKAEYGLNGFNVGNVSYTTQKEEFKAFNIKSGKNYGLIVTGTHSGKEIPLQFNVPNLTLTGETFDFFGTDGKIDSSLYVSGSSGGLPTGLTYTAKNGLGIADESQNVLYVNPNAIGLTNTKLDMFEASSKKLDPSLYTSGGASGGLPEGLTFSKGSGLTIDSTGNGSITINAGNVTAPTSLIASTGKINTDLYESSGTLPTGLSFDTESNTLTIGSDELGKAGSLIVSQLFAVTNKATTEDYGTNGDAVLLKEGAQFYQTPAKKTEEEV